MIAAGEEIRLSDVFFLPRYLLSTHSEPLDFKVHLSILKKCKITDHRGGLTAVFISITNSSMNEQKEKAKQ